MRHQEILGLLLCTLTYVVEEHNLGIVVQFPFHMYLPSVRRGRLPDILYVSRGNLNRLRETYLDGPADLVVEVTSPESVFRDREEKLKEYAAAGIPEYWLIDLVAGRSIFYQLAATGSYRVAFEGRDGDYRGRVLPDLVLPVGWLWQDPLPTIVKVQRHLGLMG